MSGDELDSREFLQEFQDQPEDIRQIFLYAICQTMVQTGILELLGVFTDITIGVTLIYRNPDSGEVFEIVKPKMTDEEEQAMRTHIGELLQEHARAV